MRTSFVGFLGAMTLLAALSVGAQEAERRRFHRRVQGSLTERVFSPSDARVLTVFLGDLPQDKEWALGVREGAEGQVQLKAMAVEFEPLVGRVLAPSAIQPVDHWIDEAHDGVIRFGRLSLLPGALVMYVQVSPRTTLRVESSAGLVLQALVGEGLTIRTGRVLAGVPVPTGLGDVLRPFFASDTSVPENELVPLGSSGVYFVGDSLLRSHLVEMQMPAYPGLDGVATILFWIDQSGRVTKIERHFGEEQLLDAAEKAVRHWRFRPFTVAGEEVTARGGVAFSFIDGKVFSSLYEGKLPAPELTQ